ncbi:MAG TPA: Bor family protein [Longimicrobiales bacterium]|nr:Bor family protein [Longimicrobiales bacterium]
MKRTVLLLIVATMASACYHATVNTGVAPGSRQIEQPWAKAFVFGLVPPDPMDAMAECGSQGVARVETQISFLNGLVSMLTFSIFTPMEITVTCGGGQASLDQGAEQDLQVVTDLASWKAALRSGEPFLLSLRQQDRG